MKGFILENIEKISRPVSLVEKLNLTSFEMKDTLNPVIFDEDEMMREDIRKILLKIGMDFYEYMDVDWVELDDIILTGSLANYNWSKYSDVDLHIVLPYNEISKNADLVDDFAWVKKAYWNNEHDIKIKDYEVELYAQDTNESLVAGGIYSVLRDKWIKKPKKVNVDIDDGEVERLVNGINKEIQVLQRRYDAGDCYGITSDINDVKDKIKYLRKDGLSKGGEFSAKNIAFKALRRLGAFDRLDDIKKDTYDNSLSVEKSREEKVKSGEIKRTPPPKSTKPNDEEYNNDDKKKPEGLGQWMINGVRYTSVRDAARELGVPKSTVHSRAKNPNFPSWKNLRTEGD